MDFIVVYSTPGRYRGTKGNISVEGGNITFTRRDGSRIIKIPVTAIDRMNVANGFMTNKLIILVDKLKISGVPRHEFEVTHPGELMKAIQKEIDSENVRLSQPAQTTKEVYVKEVTSIVKIPCPYCGTLNEITEKKCSSCGANIGAK